MFLFFLILEIEKDFDLLLRKLSNEFISRSLANMMFRNRAVASKGKKL